MPYKGRQRRVLMSQGEVGMYYQRQGDTGAGARDTEYSNRSLGGAVD